MQTFDFISEPKFRRSLEDDYSELRRCIKSQAWKSVHVLAGSIVEALLVDYLLASDKQKRGATAILKMDLAGAIAACRNDKVLSDRNADLCSVIRSYRNLIHPGRSVRLEEPTPTEESAMIAARLVDLIIREVAKVRRSEFGLTAEQIVAKLERDHTSLSILKHLLNDTSSGERERLLLNILPTRYFELQASGDVDFLDERQTLVRMERGFRIAFDVVDESIKRKVASRFVQILREEDGNMVDSYREAFFPPVDLKYVAEIHQPMVKQHLLASVGTLMSGERATIVGELAPYLSPSDVRSWVDPYVRSLVSSNIGDSNIDDIREAFVNASAAVPKVCEPIMDRRIAYWISQFKERGQTEAVAKLVALQTSIEAERLPF